MGGYIKDHRKELDSEIWPMPPLYHRVWQYLKYKANHGDGEVPLDDGTVLHLRPGQHFTSVRKIAKGVGWYEKGKFTEPNPKSVNTVLQWLKDRKMIDFTPVTGNTPGAVSGNTLGTLITLINWAFYQLDGVSGNTLEGGVTCYQGSKQKELKDVVVDEEKPPAQSGTTPSHGGPPLLDLLDAFCALHNKLDINISAKQRQLMQMMIADGIPVPFITDVMKKIYAERKAEGETVESFSYYKNPIYKAWSAQKSITDNPAPTVAVPLGHQAKYPETKKVRRSREASTAEILRRYVEGESHDPRGSSEIIHGHQFFLPEFRH